MEHDVDRRLDNDPRGGADGPARVWWIGHATLLIEMDGVRILTDPVLRTWVTFLRRHVPLPDLRDLHPVDAVLISHMHQDHLDLAGRTNPSDR